MEKLDIIGLTDRKYREYIKSKGFHTPSSRRVLKQMKKAEKLFADGTLFKNRTGD